VVEQTWHGVELSLIWLRHQIRRRHFHFPDVWIHSTLVIPTQRLAIRGPSGDPISISRRGATAWKPSGPVAIGGSPSPLAF